jgi:hypothetical protein
MRQRFYKELEELERKDAAALHARFRRKGPSGVETIRQLLSRHGVTQRGGESVAETVARAAATSAQELKGLLWEGAQTIEP